MIEFRSLKSEEMEQWFQHCMYVFNLGTYSEKLKNYFMNHWYNDPWRELESIFVAVEGGKVLSTVRVFHRKIYLQGQIISMGGIGEVSTKPECRGLGLSTKLLGLAIDRMEIMGINVSTLGTGEDKLGYYGRLGWQSLPRAFNIAKVKAQENIEITTRPVSYEKDILSIRDMYKQYSKKVSGAIVRDNEYYWENWVETEYKNCLIAEKDGKAVAYMDIQQSDMNIRVREFGAQAGYEGLFKDMLQDIVSTSGLGEGLVKYPASIETEVYVEKYVEEKGEMIRLITPFSLGDKNINTTEQLLDRMNVASYGEGKDCFTFWDADGF